MMVKILNFPHLSTTDFDSACNGLLQRFVKHGAQQSEWLAVESIEQYGIKFLRITKQIAIPDSLDLPTMLNGEEAEVEEDDDEAWCFHSMHTTRGIF